MNVVMLGGSGAGKTTYVSLMYRILADGIGGFSCRAADTADHRRLLSSGDEVLAGVYPSATSFREVHDLVLRHQGQDVFPFRWSDYRGSALVQRSDDSPQAEELHQDLKRADGIVLFHEAGPRPGRSGDDWLARRMTAAVLRSLGERDERPTPLVIAVTKCDLHAATGPDAAHRLRAPFSPLIAAVARTAHIRGAVVPLVCGPSPSGVLVPVLWTLRYGIQGLMRQVRQAVEDAAAAGQRAAAKDTRWDRFESWLTSQRSWRSISAQHYAAAAAQRARLEPLTAPAARLGDLLKEVDSF
ncbi:hypothetical protein ABZ686_21650 [Streptomyces sp. NPDC006992]|uniref:TRAFAC clade GTPase domain-containing protein n=1 Tax=unclassified Streptomyces TaxID=2593676 RepID=UPI0033CD6A10